MPSLLVGAQSGGVPIWSGSAFSGLIGNIVGGIQFKVAPFVSGIVYVGLPSPLSGGVVTINSGVELTGVGGMLDGYPVVNGEEYFVPKLRLVSGVQTLRVTCVAAASGLLRLNWQMM